MNNKALKQLKKAYNTRLKLLNDKKFLEDIGAGVLILVEKLRYLRDRLIIEDTGAEPEPEVFEDPFAEFSDNPINKFLHYIFWFTFRVKTKTFRQNWRFK